MRDFRRSLRKGTLGLGLHSLCPSLSGRRLGRGAATPAGPFRFRRGGRTLDGLGGAWACWRGARPVQSCPEETSFHSAFVCAKPDAGSCETDSGVEIKHPVVPVTGEDVASHFAGRQTGAGMRAVTLGDNEAIRRGQMEDCHLDRSGREELGVTGRAIIGRAQLGPAIVGHSRGSLKNRKCTTIYCSTRFLPDQKLGKASRESVRQAQSMIQRDERCGRLS